MSRLSPIPVFRVPHSLNPEAEETSEWTRSQFEIGPNVFVFLFLFDFYSYMERKNPLGLVEAFRQAFGQQQDVLLFLKTSHSEFDQHSFARLEKACQAPNIRLLEGILPRAAVTGLMSLCDCYVSLHRSEGFGITLLEAMSLGKPVIATAYSGNMDFMTGENSFLVNYRLTELERDYGPYKKGNVWANPDLDQAAQWMREVFENRNEAAARGRQARTDVYRTLHPSVVGAHIREKLSALKP